MKKNLLLIAITTFFFACNGEVKVDESKINDAGRDLQKTVKKGVDTIVSKAKKIRIKVGVDSTDTTTR